MLSSKIIKVVLACLLSWNITILKTVYLGFWRMSRWQFTNLLLKLLWLNVILGWQLNVLKQTFRGHVIIPIHQCVLQLRLYALFGEIIYSLLSIYVILSWVLRTNQYLCQPRVIRIVQRDPQGLVIDIHDLLQAHVLLANHYLLLAHWITRVSLYTRNFNMPASAIYLIMNRY
jgi:hypothetical protein